MSACQLALIQARNAALLCICHYDWTLHFGAYHQTTDAAVKHLSLHHQQISSEIGITRHSDYFDNHADSILHRDIARKQDLSVPLIVCRFCYKHIHPIICSGYFEKRANPHQRVSK